MGGEEEVEEVLKEGRRSVGTYVDPTGDVRRLLEEGGVFAGRVGGMEGGRESTAASMGTEERWAEKMQFMKAL